MEKHQNSKKNGFQDKGAISGGGTPRVMRAGGEAKSIRQIQRANGNGEEKAFKRGATAEATRTVLRAGQQAKEGAEDAGKVAARASGLEGAGMHVGEALNEWASFAGRAYHHNAQAMADLRGCTTVPRLLQWQSNLFTATVSDWVDTNSRVLQRVLRKP